MGLFNKKESCTICGGKAGKAIRDGYVCSSCWANTGIFGFPYTNNKNLATTDIVKERITLNNNWKIEQEKRKKRFIPIMVMGNHIMVDEENKLWSMAQGSIKKKPFGDIYAFSEIIEYELEEDGISITKGGLGRAAAGGLLFGGFGAVVGGVTSKKKTHGMCTKMNITISIRNLNFKLRIQLINQQTKKNSLLYNLGQNNASSILKYFDEITANQEEIPNIDDQELSPTEELKKYAELFNQGVLSEDEFKSIKEKLISKI